MEESHLRVEHKVFADYVINNINHHLNIVVGISKAPESLNTNPFNNKK